VHVDRSRTAEFHHASTPLRISNPPGSSGQSTNVASHFPFSVPTIHSQVTKISSPSATLDVNTGFFPSATPRSPPMYTPAATPEISSAGKKLTFDTQ